MRDVFVLGVGMHRFGKFLSLGLKDLARVAVWDAIRDAGVDARRIGCAYVGNGLAGLMTGQEGIRGQVVLRDAGLGGFPIVNVENACASSSTAFRGAWLEVASGMCDVALALGVEKLSHESTAKSIEALATDADVEATAGMGIQFPAYYAMKLREYMAATGATTRDLARVVEKSSFNGSLNPYAHFRKPLSPDEVLASRLIADPLTLYMCAPISDGAAAAILVSAEVAAQRCAQAVKVAAVSLGSGRYRRPGEADTTVQRTARAAYEAAGLGPEDIDVVELHDAMAPAELMLVEDLALCEKGGGVKLLDDGTTRITGRRPVNPSGGLTSRGHPVGATGLAQIIELYWQLTGRAGDRQVKSARVGLAQNSGGMVEGDPAATCVSILVRD